MSSFAVGRDHNKKTEERREKERKERMMRLRDNPLTLKSDKNPGSAPKTLKNRPTAKKLTTKQRKEQAKAAIDRVKKDKNKTRKISQKALEEYAIQHQSWGRGELEQAMKDKKRHDKEQKRGLPWYTKVWHKGQKIVGSKAKKERDARRAEELEKEMRDSQIYSANWKEYQQQQRKHPEEEQEENEKKEKKEIQDDQDASERRLKLKESLPTIINKRSSIINMPAPPVPPLPEGGGRTRRRKRKRRRKTKKKRRRRTKKKKNRRRRTKKRRRK